MLALGIVACGGPRSTTPAPAGTEYAPLTVRVRLPAAFAGQSLALTVYPDGAPEPGAATASVRLSSAACAVDGDERLCTFDVNAPVGLIDVNVRAGAGSGGALSGTAPRQLLAPQGSALSLAFDGTPARWAFSPQLLAAAADGATHEVAFAVLAQDVHGFTLLRNGPPAPAAVSVSGDLLHQLAVTTQGSGLFMARYGGQAVGDVTLHAAAPGAAAATAPFASLVAAPAALSLDVGQTATLSASLEHYAGPFESSAGGPNCTVSPASATPATAGGAVQFTVRLNSGAGCEVKLSAAKFNVPIVIPGKNAVANPGIGIGPSKIKHVVVLLQENRSFDNLFGGLDDNGKPFPGADTVSNPLPGEPTPHNHLGQPVPMSTGLLEECYDPYHDHPNSVGDADGGKMDGFDLEGVVQETCAPNPAPTNYSYRTIVYSEAKPYWLMGEQYVLADRMFEPFSSASYGPHLYIVAGQSENTIDNPDGGFWGCDNDTGGLVTVIVDSSGGQTGGVPPCFIAPTLGDLMDQRGVSWRFYAAGTPQHDFGYDWSAYDSFNAIRNGPDWATNVINPPAQIVTDVGNGTLAAMTWVTPLNATSDHPQAHSNLGPAWVTSVVNAIGKSKFWDSTAIFITWDDWGGWYDHVPVTGLLTPGIRVPAIVISPYARKGYVSHVTHTTGSILHFAEEVLNLPSLGQEDARQDDFMDAFNFAQKPRTFTKFAQTRSQAEIIRSVEGRNPVAAPWDSEREEGRVGD